MLFLLRKNILQSDYSQVWSVAEKNLIFDSLLSFVSREMLILSFFSLILFSKGDVCSPDPCKNSCQCQESCRDENSYYCQPPDNSPMIGKNCDWSVDFECNSGDFMIQIPLDFMTEVKLLSQTCKRYPSMTLLQGCMSTCSRAICNVPVCTDPLNLSHLQLNHLQLPFSHLQ